MKISDAIIITALSVIFVTPSLSVSKTAEIQSEKDNVEAAIKTYFRMFRDEDMSLLPQVMAADPEIVIFGTDSNEIFIGYEQNERRFMNMFKTIDFREIVLKDLNIHLSHYKSVAWFSVVSDWDIKIPDDHIVLKGIRSTGVLEKRDGRWLMVQYHASVPVDGQAVEY